MAPTAPRLPRAGMHSRVRFLGHPVHQQLVVFPLGLLGTAVVFDVLTLLGPSPTMALVAYWLIAAGLVGGVLAAPFGFIDWRAVPRGTRAARIGALHGAGNVVVLLLFGYSLWRRAGLDGMPDVLALLPSFAGLGVVVCTAWLGGELVSRLGVGVDEDAGPDAPSSLLPPPPS